MYPNLGFSEVFILCVIGLLGVGLPVAVLVLLIMIYKKLESLEGYLKNK